MTIKKFGLMALTASGMISACNVESPSSQLDIQAKANDSTVRVMKVQENGYVTPVLVSNNRGYRLKCSDPVGIKKLVVATGIDFDLLSFIPALPESDDRIKALELNKQPDLTCESDSDRRLIVSELSGEKKYFLSINTEPFTTRLYNLGCENLVDAMGFSLESATELPPSLVNDPRDENSNGIFDASDTYDISCYKGTELGVDRKLLWSSYPMSDQMDVLAGSRLPFITFEATANAALKEPISYDISSTCGDWLQSNVGSSVLVFGDVDDSLGEQSCDLNVTASSEGYPSLSYQLTLNIKSPEINWAHTPENLNQSELFNGQDIEPIRLKAISPGNPDALIQYQLVENNCDWLRIIGDAVVGRVPGFIDDQLATGCRAQVEAYLDSNPGVSTDPLAIQIDLSPYATNQLGREIILPVKRKTNSEGRLHPFPGFRWNEVANTNGFASLQWIDRNITADDVNLGGDTTIFNMTGGFDSGQNDGNTGFGTSAVSTLIGFNSKTIQLHGVVVNQNNARVGGEIFFRLPAIKVGGSSNQSVPKGVIKLRLSRKPLGSEQPYQQVLEISNRFANYDGERFVLPSVPIANNSDVRLELIIPFNTIKTYYANNRAQDPSLTIYDFFMTGAKCHPEAYEFEYLDCL